MGWLLGQTLVSLILAGLLGLIVGYLWWGRRVRKVTTSTRTVVRKMSELQGDLGRTAGERDDLRGLVAKRDEELMAVRGEHSNAMILVSTRDRDLERLQEQLATVSAGRTAALTDLAVRDRRLAELEAQIAALRGEAESAKRSFAAADTGVNDVKRVLATVQSELGGSKDALAAAQAELTAARASAASLQAELDEERASRASAAALIDLRTPADDLTRVEGIGPKMAGALQAGGITSFAQLAATPEAELRRMIEAQGLGFAPSVSTWARQSAYLVDGDEEGFVRYTDYLVAGVEPEHAGRAEVMIETRIDQLERIEGIGPKIAAALVAAGIQTFDRLRRTADGELQSAIENAGLSFAPSLGTWAKQAAFLADGDEAGFQAYADRLIAGREPGSA
jgi:predicted flap endonuclease-1-like 5' DNA nuclease